MCGQIQNRVRKVRKNAILDCWRRIFGSTLFFKEIVQISIEFMHRLLEFDYCMSLQQPNTQTSHVSTKNQIGIGSVKQATFGCCGHVLPANSNDQYVIWVAAFQTINSRVWGTKSAHKLMLIWRRKNAVQFLSSSYPILYLTLYVYLRQFITISMVFSCDKLSEIRNRKKVCL